MAEQQKVCALSHTKKQYMAVGHESWGKADLTDIPTALVIYGPCVLTAIDQFKYHNEQFGIEALCLEKEAIATGYVRVAGFWERGGTAK